MSTYIIMGLLGLGTPGTGVSLIGATATVTRVHVPVATVVRVTSNLPTTTVTRED